MDPLPPTPRFASTVVLLRDRDGGAEVLMLRRHAHIEFAGDSWVFPGGTVDEADRRLPPGHWHGIDPAALAARFAAPADLVTGFHVAAVREVFEEAGLLFGRHRGGQPVDVSAPEVVAVRTGASRGGAVRSAFHDWLRSAGVVLDLGALTYLSRWVTPEELPKRFDAAFFVARPPRDQEADHDRVEATARRWVRPATALADEAAGRMPMMYPTVRTLRWLAVHARAGDAVGAARGQREVVPRVPRVEQGPDGPRVVEDLAGEVAE